MGNQKEGPLTDDVLRPREGQTLIAHPERFMEGARVLMLKARHKDGETDERTILRVSHGAGRFRRSMNSLLEIMRPNERIYVNAGERDVKKAIRLFKERQLDADYSGDPEDFYRHIDARWASCLMAPTSQLDKFWLFDCDKPEDVDFAMDEYLSINSAVSETYRYQSKNGTHILVSPFNRQRLSQKAQAMLHDNAIILWAYS